MPRDEVLTFRCPQGLRDKIEQALAKHRSDATLQALAGSHPGRSAIIRLAIEKGLDQIRRHGLLPAGAVMLPGKR